MNIKLSNRLLAVAKQVEKDARVADIGTDHGYLAVYLTVNNISDYVIATDRAKGPLTSATQLVELLSLDAKIDTRLGDGLDVLKADEVDNICIAGMGGMTIIDILKAHPEIVGSVKKLILQPQRGASKVRRYLMENGLKIVKEEIAEDDGFYYVIIAAEPGNMELTEDEIAFGPYLLSNGHPLYKNMLCLKRRDLEQLLVSLSEDNTEELIKRKNQLNEEISQISRVIEALS
ncbi:MAG: tRNA (adenine(22)-N(1))-methyltransferase [Bacillota bacterium]